MIIRRYVLREVLQAFVAVLTVLVLVYVSNRFVGYLAEAASGRISGELLLEILFLKLVSNLVLVLPLALYIGVLLALGRLYKDGEIVAMSAGGIGTPSLARCVLGIALGFAALIGVFALYVSPQAAHMQERLYALAKQESEITGIASGRFREFGDDDQILYVESIHADGRSMRNVFAQVRREGRLEIVVAERARLEHEDEHAGRFMVLENGRRYRGDPGSRDYVVTRFHSHAVRLERDGAGAAGGRMESFPTSELLASRHPMFRAELQWRLSHPIAAVLLSLLAVALARTSTRHGRYAKLFTAVLVYFVYSNALGIAQRLVERGELPVLVGLWPVHLLMAGVVLLLLYLQSSGSALGSRARRRLGTA